MTNKKIIDFLNEISSMLELKGENKFKIRAYLKLAQFLSSYGTGLQEIYEEKGEKGLMEIPNIGEGIAKKIAEFIETGRSSYLEEIKKSLPEGILTFLEIPGMGPKTAQFIGAKFGIKTVDELEKFLEAGKLRKEKGFGEKQEQKILKGIAMYKKGMDRHLLGEALPAAREIMNYLKSKHKIDKISAAGSIRRMEDTAGDIDILAVTKEKKEVMKSFASLAEKDNITAKGDRKISIILESGIQADFRVFDRESFGAAMQYFTGSKQHNIMLREICVKKGITLNEYGLYKGKKKLAGETEKSIYKALGLQYIPPELRSGTDEIAAAKENKLPVLLERKEIKGDFHIHSEYSDGGDPIEYIALKAKDKSYEYIAITDHSKSLRVAGGLTPDKLLMQIKEIDKLNSRLKEIKVLKGTEVDILADGSLDYPDEILKKLDIVIGAVHSGFNMDKKRMTGRIIKAMKNRYVNIIAHISGRLINSREPYELDYKSIFEAAADRGTALEINCNPERLDLADIYISEAVSKGVMLSIGTDSHTTETFDYMEYGAAKARRGRAEAGSILNTMCYDDLMKWINSLRK